MPKFEERTCKGLEMLTSKIANTRIAQISGSNSEVANILVFFKSLGIPIQVRKSILIDELQ